MPVLGEGGVAGNLLIETQAGEAPSHEMHAQALHQLVLARHALPIADQKNAQQQLRINRGPTGLTVAVFQLLPHKLEIDVLVDQP